MALGEGYLPPVVATVEATAADLVRVLAQAKAMLADFAKTDTKKRIGGDLRPLEGDLARARAEGDAAAAKPIVFSLRLDVGAAMAQLEAFKTYASVSTARAVAGWNAATAAAATAALGAGLASGGGGQKGGGGGGAGFWAGLMSGWGRNFGQGRLWQNILGFGGGKGFLGLAGMGSIGAMAGLGFEHLLMTGIGLGGSLGAAGLGAGALGMGSLGVIGAGGGSDMAVMSSTLADTFKNQDSFSKLYQQLANDVAVYGANSQQAAADTTLLNNQMLILGNTAGVKAEMGVAQLAVTLNKQWDQATSAARVQAAAIMTQVLQLGQDYVPLVANAAQKNLSIINQSLVPLFAWLEGPQGMGIFNDLETKFSSDLPYAIGAFDNGIELLLKMMDYASQYTGGFIRSLDAWLTKLNTPDGFAKVEHVVDDLIGYFRLWWDIVKNLGRDIYALFSHDAGTAKTILVWLDQMLKKLGEWERSASGGEQLHSVFETHKDQVMALLNVLVPLVEGVGKVYLTLAPAFTKALTTVLTGITPFLDAMVKTPWGAWALGIGVLAGKFGLLGAVLGPVASAVASIALNWAKIAWGSISGFFGWGGAGSGSGAATAAGPDTVFSGAVDEFAAAVTRFAATTAVAGAEGAAGEGVAGGEGAAGAAEGAGVLGGLSLGRILGLILPGVGGGLLGDLIGGGIGQSIGGTMGGHIGGIVGGGLGGAALGMGLGGPLGALAGGAVGLITATVAQFWPQITGAMGTAFGNIAMFFRNLPQHMAGFFGTVLGAIGGFFGAVGGWFKALPGHIAGFFTGVGSAIGGFFGAVGRFFSGINPEKLGAAVHNALGWFFGQVGAFFTALPGRIAGFFTTVFGAIGRFFGAVGGFFAALPGRIANFFGGIFAGVGNFLHHVADFFVNLPGQIANFFGGIFAGVGNFLNHVADFFVNLPGQIAGFLGNLIGSIGNAISGLAQGIANAIGGIVGHIGGFFSGIAGGIGNFFGGIGGFFKGLFTGHALGGTIAPGTWGTVGEQAVEVAYAMPGGGVQIFPIASRGNGLGVTASTGGGTTVNLSAPVSITIAGAANPQQIAQQIEMAVERSWDKVLRHIGAAAR